MNVKQNFPSTSRRQLIRWEILEHYQYRGQIMRVLFTAQDPQTIRDAFGRAKPNAEYALLFSAGTGPSPGASMMAPGDGVPERPLACRQVPRTADEQWQAMLQAPK